MIAAKSSVAVNITLTAFKGDRLDKIFVCEVQGMTYPLGFTVNTKVFGLSVDVAKIVMPSEKVEKLKVTEENDNTNLFNTLIMKSHLKNSHLFKTMRDSVAFEHFQLN